MQAISEEAVVLPPKRKSRALLSQQLANQKQQQIMHNQSNLPEELYHTEECCSSRSSTIVLLLFGFYFLIFALIEFITNTHAAMYRYTLHCNSNFCYAETGQLRFAAGKNISVYLQLPDISQNSIFDKNSWSLSQLTGSNITDCKGGLTNAELGVRYSITGARLDPKAVAFPCGQLSILYPRGTLSFTNLADNNSLFVDTGSINHQKDQEVFKNGDLSKQWLDVTEPRFRNWMDISTIMSNKKLWGTVLPDISGRYKIEALFDRMPVSSIIVELDDNESFGGYNPAQCILHFIASGCCFLFTVLSYSLQV